MKISLLIMSIWLVGCYAKTSTNPPKSFVSSADNVADTVPVDLKNSIIKWKGTKMRGLGKHEGTINLASGFLLFSKETLTGGSFTFDMRTINVTDIPEHEPVPRRNLINHLKSEEFFEVETFPEAQLIITSCTSENETFNLVGDLTIKGQTHPISFEAKKTKYGYESTLEIDRFIWDVAYTGSWANRTLVDRMVEFNIQIKIPKSAL
ncbi:YceI family protein [Ekhidna sp.]|uniref:YceI family protein n=1 Tax=Ekhidna sp. TaxID=2608089 RepID=UPI003298BAA0